MRASVCVWERACVCESERVCVWERACVCVRASVCVWEWASARACVCVCERSKWASVCVLSCNVSHTLVWSLDYESHWRAEQQKSSAVLLPSVTHHPSPLSLSLSVSLPFSLSLSRSLSLSCSSEANSKRRARADETDMSEWHHWER